jgi:hypothetical protein
MRKLLIIAIALIVLVGLFAGVIGSARQLASSSSPKNRYVVRIDQRRMFPGIERYVYLNASRDGKPFLTGKLLYTGDFLDNEFRDLYPNYSWLSESILKIGQPDSQQSDTLHITNNSTQLKYLLIETYENKFVLFDLEPGRVADLPFHYYGRLSCQGEFAETGRRFGDAVELPDTHESTLSSPTTFTVALASDGVKIASQISLKHVTCCAVDRNDINHE